MDEWIVEALRLTRMRAPGLPLVRALDVAQDLHDARPDDTPADAVQWFFSFMPVGWHSESADAAPAIAQAAVCGNA